MTVSKRIRYEVLRRDEYTCRYCRSAENLLTVDHVTPVALGGTDDPSNLVAACRDCNAGKSSAAPDSSLVADVRDDAIRHAELIKKAYEVLVEQIGNRDDYIDSFLVAWNEFHPEPGRVWKLPETFRSSIDRWFRMGVPVELLEDAARITTSTDLPHSATTDSRFRYFCKIVWNQVHAVTEAAFEKTTLDGRYMTESSLTDERIEAYDTGFKLGHESGIYKTVVSAWLRHWNPVVAFVDLWPKDEHGISGGEIGVDVSVAGF